MTGTSKLSSTVKTFVALGAAGYLMYAGIAYTNDIRSTVSESINTCLGVIIPSLYWFMIISAYILRSGIMETAGAFLDKTVCRFVNFSGSEMVIFIISLFAGYPVGIKLIYEMSERGLISRKRADALAGFCCFSGPAFIVGTVSARLYGSIKIGMIIFLSNIIANVIIGSVILLASGEKAIKGLHGRGKKISLGTETLIESVRSSAVSLLNICTLIVMFSIIYTIIEKAGISDAMASFVSDIFSIEQGKAYAIIASAFEISRISGFEAGNYGNIPVIAALMSFGGICVIMQVVSVSKGKLNFIKFFFTRIAGAVISYFVCSFLIKSIALETLEVAYRPEGRMTEYSLIPSVALLFMTLIILSKKDWTEL